IRDIGISDVMMPVMNGIEYVEKIREDETANFIPVIILTGNDTKEDMLKVFEHGANDYILKPFDIDELKALLKSTLKSKKLLKARFETGSAFINVKKENLKSADQKFIEEVRQSILENLADSSLSVETLAAKVHVGRTTLH